MSVGDVVVSVNIPCYQQIGLARYAVGSFLAQSFGNFELTLIDDGASEEYEEYVRSLSDPRVRYRRNPRRLGAMANMFGAIAAGHAPYSIAFHEDDLLSRDYLAAALSILETHPSCAFVACELREFKGELAGDELSKPNPRPAYDLFPAAPSFVRGILHGAEPMFGSCLYRRAALRGVSPAHDAFGPLVDRPFLISLLKSGWSAAVIREPLAWYRHHADGDQRHREMTTDHVLGLFRAYRDCLPTDWTKHDKAAFYSYTGYWLYELYRLTPPDNRPTLRRLLFRAWREGVYDPRWRGRSGLLQVLRALLGRSRLSTQ
jgi:glycosyltransferase involved in cell wall biosynthesis